MEEQSCLSCRYSSITVRLFGRLACLVNGPSCAMVKDICGRDEVRTIFPLMFPDQWCGKYEPETKPEKTRAKEEHLGIPEITLTQTPRWPPVPSMESEP